MFNEMIQPSRAFASLHRTETDFISASHYDKPRYKAS